MKKLLLLFILLASNTFAVTYKFEYLYEHNSTLLKESVQEILDLYVSYGYRLYSIDLEYKTFYSAYITFVKE